ncbi:hypothetical protein NE237_028616 [Protea cynaroides]|uniref:Uncharacterized protein n=1 Tax=Protea cynaroides TaxID=273540 RepID=A0A9Q0JT23_9MAGN|nr:hypothetical protein NE237_028616 [Protea cynaroides]
MVCVRSRSSSMFLVALDEFRNLYLNSSVQRSEDGGENKQEKPALATDIQGLGAGLSNLRGKKQGNQIFPRNISSLMSFLGFRNYKVFSSEEV